MFAAGICQRLSSAIEMWCKSDFLNSTKGKCVVLIWEFTDTQFFVMVLFSRHWSGRRKHFWHKRCRLRRAKDEAGRTMHLAVRMVSTYFSGLTDLYTGIILSLISSVIFVNENENENGEKRENNKFVNEN